jgi:branched-chain amino acid transport system permease protein
MDMTKAVSNKLFIPGLLFLILVLLVIVPYFGGAYNVVLFTAIMMYIILTVSWTIFSGSTGYISLAPAAFLGVGIYTMAVLGKDLPLIGVIIVAGIINFILALLIGALTLRLKGIYFAIFTFGLVVLIKQIVLFWEVTVTHTRGRTVVLESNNTIYYYMLGIFVVLMAVAYIIRHSKYGLALQSIGENEEAAAHIGINVTLVKVIAFAVSAIFMGAAGAIWATKLTYIDPYVAFNVLFSFLPVLMAIFGGTAQLYGPVIGAALFAYLEELLITRYPDYFMLGFGIILIIVILYLPGGLVGLVQKLRRGGLAKTDAHT